MEPEFTKVAIVAMVVANVLFWPLPDWPVQKIFFPTSVASHGVLVASVTELLPFDVMAVMVFLASPIAPEAFTLNDAPSGLEPAPLTMVPAGKLPPCDHAIAGHNSKHAAITVTAGDHNQARFS